MTTRVALRTPPGRGAVAVIELEGTEARDRLQRLAGALPAPGALAVRSLEDAGERLEEAVLVGVGPESFEVHLTASPPVVRRVLAALGGVVDPSPTSVEERALAALAEAASEDGARVLLDQAAGALRRAFEAHLADSPEDWLAFGNELDEAARVAEPALRPKRVVLAGPTNAGKSTLFNLLVGEQRVVVSEEAGTTRDAVVAEARLGSWPVVLVDTAGERELPEVSVSTAPAGIERAGQDLGRAERADADLVLWLHPSDAAEPPAPAGGGTRVLVSRADLDRSPRGPAGPALSAVADPAGARALVTREFREHFDLPESAWRPGRPVPLGTEARRLVRSSGWREAKTEDQRRALGARLLGEG